MPQVTDVLDVEFNFPKVNLRFPNGLSLATFHAVLDTRDRVGGSCNQCAFKNTQICRHVDCNNVFYVMFTPTPCL